MSARPPGRGMSHIEIFQGQIKQYMVWSCRSESLIWAPGPNIHTIYIQVTTSTSLLSPFFLYIYMYHIYIYICIWMRRYDFPPKSSQKGSSGLFGAWQRANSSHCTHVWSHTSIYIYIYINTENCWGNSAPLYVQHILLEECPLYTSRGADVEYLNIYIYICTPSCLLNTTSEWLILSLLGGKALSLFQVPWSAG